MAQGSGLDKKYTPTQKLGLLLLGVFALLTVGLGFLQLRNNIFGPFVLRVNRDETEVTALLDDVARLQQVDTDHDGLNDYEEMNFYQTSAYLSDTDSDGIEDKAEIEAGTDPLCPEDKVCGEAEALPVATTTSPVISPLSEGLTTPLDALSEGGNISLSDIETLVNNPAQLRELLLQSGKIPKETLDGVDDATLVELARELVGEQLRNATSTR